MIYQLKFRISTVTLNLSAQHKFNLGLSSLELKQTGEASLGTKRNERQGAATYRGLLPAGYTPPSIGSNRGSEWLIRSVTTLYSSLRDPETRRGRRVHQSVHSARFHSARRHALSIIQRSRASRTVFLDSLIRPPEKERRRFYSCKWKKKRLGRFIPFVEWNVECFKFYVAEKTSVLNYFNGNKSFFKDQSKKGIWQMLTLS